MFLCAFDERDDVAHAEDTIGHAVGVEDVEGFHLFAGADKLDGFVHHGADGEGGTAAGVTVELGEHHAVEVEAGVELLGGVHRVLTGHGVDHEEGFVGRGGGLHGGDLVHEGFVDGEAAGGVDNHRVVALGLGFLNGGEGDLDGIFLFEIHEDGHFDLLGEDAELLDGGGAIGVAGGEERTAVFLRLEEEGEFTGEGGLTGTVETGHEDDGGAVLEFEVHALAAHEGGEFVVNNLDHELRGLHGSEHVLAEGLLLHGVGEGFGHLVVDVGVEQGAAHVFEGFGYVDLGDLAFTFQYFERAFKSFAKIVEHVYRWILSYL